MEILKSKILSLDVSSSSQVGIYSDLEIYFTFDGDSGTSSISSTDDLLIPKETLTFIKVPRGVGSTIYIHVKATSSDSTKYCRIVTL